MCYLIDFGSRFFMYCTDSVMPPLWLLDQCNKIGATSALPGNLIY